MYRARKCFEDANPRHYYFVCSVLWLALFRESRDYENREVNAGLGILHRLLLLQGFNGEQVTVERMRILLCYTSILYKKSPLKTKKQSTNANNAALRRYHAQASSYIHFLSSQSQPDDEASNQA